ncbi:hypothetical protein K8I61_17765 [bacterium]|nr:hypothetical protein [bacterium]
MKAMQILMAMILVLLVGSFSVAFAQDDDTAADDDAADDDTAADDDMDDDAADDDDDDDFSAEVTFSSPTALEADSEYEFEFSVANTTSADVEGNHWVYLVEMFMPSPDYVIDSASVHTPDPLHPSDGDWNAQVIEDVDGTQGILWEFNNIATTAINGDIQEGESLDFSFMATTDADATDGFPWRVVADSGLFDTGVAEIGGSADDDTDDDTDGDDDDAADDDTDGEPSGGDDDDDDGGCGC